MSQVDSEIRSIYRWPLVLAVVILSGLFSALFGDGAWNVLSWVLLMCPLILVARFIFK
jgi:uncharacterized membrane protein YjjP (DUF1212 family)